MNKPLGLDMNRIKKNVSEIGPLKYTGICVFSVENLVINTGY
jgi:hypothetical protein